MIKLNKIWWYGCGIALALIAYIFIPSNPSGPKLPVQETIYSKAITAVDYQIGKLTVADNGQAYGAIGSWLVSVNAKDVITNIYQFTLPIAAIHITDAGQIIVSTDANPKDMSSHNTIYQSDDKGQSFTLINTLTKGSALWWSISSDKLGNLYIGEYGEHSADVIKQVYRRNASDGQWQVIFNAPLHEEAHIHRVAIDPYSQNLWVSVGDGKANRGLYRSKDQGDTWQKMFDSQSTAVAFTAQGSYWGSDKKNKTSVVRFDAATDKSKQVFVAGKYGNYTGSIYQMVALADGSVLVPIMKYGDRDNVASLWHGNNDNWRLLMEFESSQGSGVDLSSISAPDKSGFVYFNGHKLEVSKLEPLDLD